MIIFFIFSDSKMPLIVLDSEDVFGTFDPTSSGTQNLHNCDMNCTHDGQKLFDDVEDNIENVISKRDSGCQTFIQDKDSAKISKNYNNDQSNANFGNIVANELKMVSAEKRRKVMIKILEIIDENI